ncbi:uncharacterized protein LOC110031388 isoform X2 [Phalaenopsis equestris]|uniref:uncharacterized protein LOC110031388 isoform X2 n=1 Tax=Phalaenopsis equestris TaxID=78828 RepID=UPI0009E49D81|nr:uncharacterized protein LOC110031388 isoform X2 [Phalaenopsis equestris]
MAMLTVRPTRALPCSFSDFSAALPPGFPFCSFSPYLPTLVSPRRLRSFRCSTSSSDHHKSPPLLKSAISGLTELLRTFSPKKRRDDSGFEDAPLAGSVDDVLQILSIDYGRAYFLTGIAYELCSMFDLVVIEILLQTFMPTIACLRIPPLNSLGCNNGTNFIIAKWKLRTYLKFPWRPFISITGTTTYDLNEEFHIVKHAENWNISPLEAIGQIFAPGSREVGE